jgi:hypothetical protein
METTELPTSDATLIIEFSKPSSAETQNGKRKNDKNKMIDINLFIYPP